ncbi:hypothetical protein PV08_08228 [Exophiala spinifera]|uniref:Clr5 domain-containing protein n=1 Tax=Exophiala spinifera TaxID=91928 RepID=A0A0D1YDJ0_9EURO|nr:uncharacterized protein PV08_08228 [Exophiala spinifera]KIW13041.1 hypothetical protein PV08_08228 [Exophiala spinifera]
MTNSSLLSGKGVLSMLDQGSSHQENSDPEHHNKHNSKNVSTYGISTEIGFDEVRNTIEDLYQNKNHSLSEVREEMKKYGFRASEREYKANLKSWGIGKNASRADWLYFLRVHQERLDSGMSETFLLIHNKIRRIQDVRRYLKGHREDEAAFLAEALASEVPKPEYIHLCDANGGLIETTPRPVHDITEVEIIQQSSMLPGDCYLGPRIVEEHQAFTSGRTFQDLLVRGSSGSSPVEDLEVASSTTLLPRLDSGTTVCDDQIENWHHQNGLSETEQLQFMAGLDAAPAYGESPTRGNEQEHVAQAYATACMGACMYHAAGRRDVGRHCLQQATIHFSQMCCGESPFILIAASMVLTWMTVHAEGNIATSVMSACWTAAKDVLGAQNSITKLLEWMTAAAGGVEKLRASSVNAKTLRHVWQSFLHRLGEAHGHTIVGLYCLSFQLILADKLFVEAEEYLQGLSSTSIKSLGLDHLQTIIILATLSRAQYRQRKFSSALETIDRSLAACPLGEYHPHRLEMLIRKALILKNVGRLDETEKIYWLVAEARAATLGMHHRATIAAHGSLVDVLKMTGAWEEKKLEAHRLVTNPQLMVSEYESTWRRIVEANRPYNDNGSSDEE